MLQKIVRPWPVYLALAAGLSGACLWIVGTDIVWVPELAGCMKAAYAAAYALAIWSWTFGLIGMCLRIFAQESRVRRYIADASYWLYLIHLPIIMALQVWVSQWALAAEIKFIIILGLSVPLMLLSYEFLVRYSFIGGLLNGRIRKRRPRNTAEIRS